MGGPHEGRLGQVLESRVGDTTRHGQPRERLQHDGPRVQQGLVHSVIGTPANVNDVTQAAGLLHGQESDAWGDAGYQGVAKRDELRDTPTRWHVAMRPGKRCSLDTAWRNPTPVDHLSRRCRRGFADLP